MNTGAKIIEGLKEAAACAQGDAEPKRIHRLQLELPMASFERLKRMRDKTEAASYIEVLKNALRLYEALVDEAEAGNTVCIKQKDGDETSYRMIF